MKKTIAIASLILATSAPLTHAMSTEAKQGTSFLTSAFVGAVAGGPVGLLVGALGGAYMGEQIKKADTMDMTEAELAAAEAQVAELRQQLLAANQSVEEMEQLALNSLNFQVLFHTGKDELTARGTERVHALANFLKDNPRLQVRLDGYADPRGTDEYNNVLSDYRARSVETDLVDAGIDASRIQRHYHGADQSRATQGDVEAYASERRVNIEIYNIDTDPGEISNLTGRGVAEETQLINKIKTGY